MITLPGETQTDAVLRRVKMHEFLMTGGVPLTYNGKGQMIYGDPVTAASHPVCPWHDRNCEAWTEIVEGRGFWTAMEAQLADLQAELDLTFVGDEEIPERIDALIAKLEMRPRDAATLRARTTDEVATEIKQSKARRAAIAKSQAISEKKIVAGLQHLPNWQGVSTNGVVTTLCDNHRRNHRALSDATTWSRIPISRSQCDVCDGEVQFDAAPVKQSFGNPWDKQPMYAKPEPIQDSRDDAVEAFANLDIVDEIVIDGDEGEEGEGA